MTKYLNSQPFSAPTSNGRMTDLEYYIAVGAITFCEKCDAHVNFPHHCPPVPKVIVPNAEESCDCEGCA